MSATVSTDFLLRVAQATPEQQAAIDRFLRGLPAEIGGEGRQGGERDESEDAGGVLDALLRIEKKVDAVRAGSAGAPAEPANGVGEGEARRVFVLMQRLESGPKQRKASLGTVFRMVVLEGLSQRAAAARCGCVESLISARVVAIERAFGMSVERLRSFASALLSLESAAKGRRTREKEFGRPEMMESDGDDEEQRFGDEGEDEER